MTGVMTQQERERFDSEVEREQFDAEQVTTSTMLREVRGLIAQPENWTQCAFARDADRFPVGASKPDAKCWCLYGAACCVRDRHEGHDNHVEVVHHLVSAIRNTHPNALEIASTWGTATVVDFNDCLERLHTDVVEVLDAAIASADVEDAEAV